MILISCTDCGSKMRVPDTAAGKRVKCPKCATVVQVPKAEESADTAAPPPETFGVSEAPLPPAPPPVEIETPKEESPADSDGTEVTAEAPRKSSSSGAKPPPLKSKRSRSSVDDNDDDDDEPEPPKSKRRREDDDDDDDGLDVRRRGRGLGQPTNGLAMTSMVLGIVAISVVTLTCCCCGLYGPIIGGPIGGICSIVAIILGFMGKTPGSESYAWTGIICGSVTLVLIVAMIVLAVVGVSAAVFLEQQQKKAFR